jgi:hypothetical protein
MGAVPDESECRAKVLRALRTILTIGLLLLGPFLIGAILLLLGIAGYVWVMEPKRVAVLIMRDKGTDTERVRLIQPQPLVVSATETNIRLFSSSVGEEMGFPVASAAVWVDGKSFKSGAPAARELVKGAWPFWLAGAVGVGALIFLRRPPIATRSAGIEPSRRQSGLTENLDCK